MVLFLVGQKSHVLYTNTANVGKESTGNITILGYYFCDQHIRFSRKKVFWKIIICKIPKNYRV